MQVLVLASGSQYRANLLKRLMLPFCQFSPDIDESAHSSELPADLAQRLARGKACAPSLTTWLNTQAENDDSTVAQHDNPLIIASDQVASVNQILLGKPGTVDRARQQLHDMSGRKVTFSTALHMVNLTSGEHFSALDTTIAHLRKLSTAEINRYIDDDNPLDCAGSFKVEALGISLFESVESQDPTALEGLPLIAVCEGLRQFGVPVP